MYTQNRTDGMIEPPVRIAPTGSYAHILRVNRFSFAAPECKFKSGKARNAFDAERAITDTIKYLGVMSLKNSDHAGDKKDVTQATAQRAAADRLIAAGTVVLLGTWSNGIAVGPGVGFSAATNEPEVIAPVKAVKGETYAAKKAAATKRMKAQAAKTLAPATTNNDSLRVPHAPLHTIPMARLYRYIGWRCDWAPAPMHGPAFVAKPRVRVPLATMQACSPRWVATIARDEADDTITAAIEAITGEEYAPVNATWITTLRVVNNEPVVYHETVSTYGTDYPEGTWTPRVGDTVAITYQHERMTTDRVVTVQRVAADGKTFRGYDRTYDRVRNYDMARVLTIRRLGGEGVEIAAG